MKDSMKNKQFHDNYRKWEDDCLAEFNAKYKSIYGNRVLDGDGPKVVEFSEDGDAYPHGIGGTNHVKSAVTPWKKSQHFVR